MGKNRLEMEPVVNKQTKSQQRSSPEAVGMHGWIRHPSELLPPWRLQGRIQTGVPGEPAVPRHSHTAGTSQGAPCRHWHVQGDVFPSPATLSLQILRIAFGHKHPCACGGVAAELAVWGILAPLTALKEHPKGHGAGLGCPFGNVLLDQLLFQHSHVVK